MPRMSPTAKVVLARSCRSLISGERRDECPTLRTKAEWTAAKTLETGRLGEIKYATDHIAGAGAKVFVPNDAGFALFHHSVDDAATIIEDERAGR